MSEFLKIKVGAASVDVELTHEGKFFATYLDERFESDRFADLERQLQSAVTAQRTAIPFADEDGRAGILRGNHATRRELLVTWDDTENKDRLSSYAQVFVGAALTDGTVDEVRRLEEKRRGIDAQLRGLRQVTVRAQDALADVLGVRR